MISRNFQRYHLAALPALTMLCQLALRGRRLFMATARCVVRGAGGSPLANVPAPGHQSAGAEDDEAEFDKAADLLRALRRLPRRAAQGSDRQALTRTTLEKAWNRYLKVFISTARPAACRTGGRRAC